ncbi:glycosyltransferase [Chelatococcus reniformis]|uniref:glycosyltransferase n=1 Tax=Chelatococcus reniformis TaxID=1494448 RepID=UPI001AEECC43|nr:glycosyltransferase [Chelatococcus reniformis]
MVEAPDLFFLYLRGEADHQHIAPQVVSRRGREAEFHVVELNSSVATAPVQILWPIPELRAALRDLPDGATQQVLLRFPVWVSSGLASMVDWLAFAEGPDAANCTLWGRIPLRDAQVAQDGSLHTQLRCPGFNGAGELFLAVQFLPGGRDVAIGSPVLSWDISAPARPRQRNDNGLGLAHAAAPAPRPAGTAATLRVESNQRLSIAIRSARPAPELALTLNGIPLDEFAPWTEIVAGEEWLAELDIASFYGVALRANPELAFPLRFALVDAVTQTEIAAATHEGPAYRARGHIDTVAAGAIRGWAAAGQGWDEPIDVTVLVDGAPVHTLTAGEPRGDLERLGIAAGYGGFSLRFGVHPVWPVRPLSEVKIQWALNGQDIATAKQAMGAAPRTTQRSKVYAALAAIHAKRPTVSIVIPVYNAAEELRACLISLRQFTPREGVRWIVIDDSSPDADVAAVLSEYVSADGVEIHKNEANIGFTRTVNKGIALAGGDDVILLNSDTTVMPRWLENLRLAAYSDWNVATVTPLSDNAGPFSVPQPGAQDRLAGGAFDELGRLVSKASARLWPEVPTGHGFCLYIRRDCIEAIGPFDAEAFPIGYGEENDFCMRALRRGFKNIIDDRTFIHHVRSASFGEAKQPLYRSGREIIDERYPEYTELVRQCFTGVDIATIRSRVGSALLHAQWPTARVKRSILYVISKETGGTPQTNIDLMNGVSDDYDTYLLKSDNVTVTLERHSPQGRELLETLDLDLPLEITSHRSQEYDSVVAEWLVAYCIDMIHIRHFCWHSVGLFDAAAMLGVPVVMSFHDFYFVCPTIKLLDHDLTYCGGTCTAGEGRCRVDLWKPRSMPTLKHRWVHAWRAMFAGQLGKCAAFVTTSPYAKQVLLQAFPTLAERPFPVIPHGRDFQGFARTAPLPSRHEPLRIVVPGNIGPPKGSELLKAVKELDVGNVLDIHIVGNADKGLADANITLHGAYERERATEIFAALNPHIGAILSIWPETYCHTLTELWSAGIPVLGFDLGAVGERIAQHRGGWLMPISAPEEVYRFLLSLRSDPAELARGARAVHAWQEGEGSHYTVRDMAGAYKHLYREVGGW